MPENDQKSTFSGNLNLYHPQKDGNSLNYDDMRLMQTDDQPNSLTDNNLMTNI